MLSELANKRHELKAMSGTYTGLISVGFELVSLSKDEQNLDHIAHMSWDLAWVADYLGFKDLHDIFFDIQIDQGFFSKDGVRGYFESVKNELQELKKEKVNPSVSGDDKDLLDEFSMPILVKMTENPGSSPEYFIELAKELDRLINDNNLSIPAAGEELGFTLDRIQIMNDLTLRPAVEKAYELELPNIIRKREPLEVWREFMKLIPREK